MAVSFKHAGSPAESAQPVRDLISQTSMYGTGGLMADIVLCHTHTCWHTYSPHPHNHTHTLKHTHTHTHTHAHTLSDWAYSTALQILLSHEELESLFLEKGASELCRLEQVLAGFKNKKLFGTTHVLFRLPPSNVTAVGPCAAFCSTSQEQLFTEYNLTSSGTVSG